MLREPLIPRKPDFYLFPWTWSGFVSMHEHTYRANPLHCESQLCFYLFPWTWRGFVSMHEHTYRGIPLYRKSQVSICSRGHGVASGAFMSTHKEGTPYRESQVSICSCGHGVASTEQRGTWLLLRGSSSTCVHMHAHRHVHACTGATHLWKMRRSNTS